MDEVSAGACAVDPRPVRRGCCKAFVRFGKAYVGFTRYHLGLHMGVWRGSGCSKHFELELVGFALRLASGGFYVRCLPVRL